MTNERTEEAGLSGLLEVTIGGQAHTLPALTIDQSDAWLDELAVALADTDILNGDSGQDTIRALLHHAATTVLRLVVAYDTTGVLGGVDEIRRRATKRELADALEKMVKVEDPFGEGTQRLVVAAFGYPVRLAAERLEEQASPMLRLVRSLSTPSEPGASTTSGTSEPDGPASSSSSTGPTPSTGTSRTLRRKAS